MAQKFLTEITLQALNNATTDTDQFLVSDSGTIKFRTGSQMLSDIVGYTPANDANVVHKTGNESIAGIKTFTQGNTTFSNATGSTLAFTTGAVTTAEIIINTTFTQFTTFGSFGYLFNGYSGGGISNLLTLDQSGNGVFSANVRATSFTDKDNTAYYLNPASSSNLYDVTANKFVKQGGTSVQYLMADGSVSTGPSLTGYVPTSRTLTINGVTYDLSTNRSWTVSVTETDTLATVVDRGNTTNGGRPISMDTSGGGISIKGSGGGWATGYYFTGTAGTYRGGFGALGGNDNLSYYWIGPAYNTYYAYVDEDQLYHTSSVRAPIFYDSNDTNYYVDLASTSNLLGLTVVNTITGNISGTAGSLLSYQSNWASTPTPTNVVGLLGWKNYGNGHVIFDASASTTPSGTGCSSTNPTVYWQASFPTLMGWNGTNTYGVRVDSARVADSAGSAAWSTITGKPSYIFYYQGFTLDANTMDTNASGFTYANNAPFTGPISRFSANGDYDMWINSPYSSGGYGFAFRTRNGDTATLNPWRYPAIYGINANGGGDLYATIYYDQNDTAYYVNPNGTSNINGLLVGGLNVIKTWQTINNNIDSDYGEGFVTFDPIPPGTPPLASPNIRTVNIGNNFSRRTQLAFDYASDSAYFRRRLDSTWYSWREFIHSGNIGSQSVSYATTAGTASSASSVDWSNIASKPAWMTTTSLIASQNNANDWRNSGFYENDGGGSNWPSNTWYNSINVRHSNQGNYHGFQMAMSYYDNNLWFRSYQGAGTFQAWETAIGSGSSNQSKTGFFQSNSSLRAPIFYDANNTSFYIDPSAGGTAANLAGTVVIQGGSNPAITAIQVSNIYGSPFLSSYYGTLYSSSTFYVGNPAGTLYDAYGQNARFSLYYDRDNTAYYVDPSTTSVLNTLNMSFNNNSYGSALSVTNSNTGSQSIAGLSMSAGGKFGSINMFATGYIDILNQDTTNGGIQFRPKSAVSMYIDNISSTSRVTIGTGNTASHPLRVTQQVSNVSIYADYDIVAYSDQSVKENIRPIENVLERINNSRGVLYDRTDSGEKNNIGFIAQELEVEFPELVVTNEDNTKAVKYQNAVAVLFEAVKEQQKQIEELKELVNKLINK